MPTGLGIGRPFKLLSAASTNLTAVNAGRTEVSNILASAAGSASDMFLKIYDAPNVAAVTVGTTIPVFTLPMPGSTKVTPPEVSFLPPMLLLTGCVIAITGGIADTDSSNATVGGVVNITFCE